MFCTSFYLSVTLSHASPYLLSPAPSSNNDAATPIHTYLRRYTLHSIPSRPQFLLSATRSAFSTPSRLAAASLRERRITAIVHSDSDPQTASLYICTAHGGRKGAAVQIFEMVSIYGHDFISCARVDRPAHYRSIGMAHYSACEIEAFWHDADDDDRAILCRSDKSSTVLSRQN